MDALDGNAIAGALFDHFGVEMTATRGVCAHCGTRAQVAELVVYLRAPAAVVRCRSCGGVVMVVVSLGGRPQIDHSRFELLTA
jgi:ribosomal protein S27E